MTVRALPPFVRSRGHVLIVVLGFALAAPFAAASPPGSPIDPGPVLDLDASAAGKDPVGSGTPVPGRDLPGDTIADAIPIPALPFETTGNTCAYTHDYDEFCPYGGSTAPDIVYRWTPTQSESWVDILLCDSAYDTKLLVYENDAATLVACNDDACGSDGYRSAVWSVPLVGGNDYYIVVTGYGAQCGDYDLLVEEVIVEQLECPPGAWAEGEPPCGDGYVDEFNGGCGSFPPVFSPLPCAITPTYPAYVCGETGGFDLYGMAYRDTDWYVVDPLVNTEGFTWCATSEVLSTFGYVPALPCDQISTLFDWMEVHPLDVDCLEVPPGAWYLWVSSSGFGSTVGCGDYVMWLDGYDCGAVPVRSVGWGRIKARYR